MDLLPFDEAEEAAIDKRLKVFQINRHPSRIGLTRVRHIRQYCRLMKANDALVGVHASALELFDALVPVLGGTFIDTAPLSCFRSTDTVGA